MSLAILAMMAAAMFTGAPVTEVTDITYRVGEYRCADNGGDPVSHLCVFDPDPVGDPRAVEPDNGAATMREHAEHGAICGSDLDCREFDAHLGVPAEDEPGFDCRMHGNRICGPGSEYPAGCYRDGALVVPWSDYREDEHGNPSGDPLWGADGCDPVTVPGDQRAYLAQGGTHGYV